MTNKVHSYALIKDGRIVGRATEEMCQYIKDEVDKYPLTIDEAIKLSRSGGNIVISGTLEAKFDDDGKLIIPSSL